MNDSKPIFYKTPFHVTHSAEKADKMAAEVDNSILLHEGLSYFESEDAFATWMKTPNVHFGSEPPSDYVASHDSGDLKVIELIIRMKNGLTA